ncbi:glycosyl hydrolase [Stylonychia lemnae]|uniref:Glycosyl hydrolase n=1 Tax=Stylonychia lemnae TaxID=5949 RepID=A0A078B801_STYLE|nr:glycosyl hydrolase [Stylonychia lemnae]|eukprot:CDW90346.1 glycosyl hydrolase [Stylonychia lemnae]
MSIIIIAFLGLTSLSSVQGFYNPVINENVPDPGAILYDNEYYVVTTSGPLDGKFPIHKSSDLQNWDFMGYALPRDHSPQWAQSPDTDFWAPELHVINGMFRLYFTARHSSGVLCIGVATADNILGPYTDIGSPLFQNPNMGSIDATVFKDEFQDYWLVWKDDGNGKNPQQPTIIRSKRLSYSGLSFEDSAMYELIKNDQPWEGDVTEGPWMIRKDGFYYLFYSGHGYCDQSYSVGVARSRSPWGPFKKKGSPILFSSGNWQGPGHCSVIKTSSDDWVIIYHSWMNNQVCGNNKRVMLADFIDWDWNQWPQLRNMGALMSPKEGSSANSLELLFLQQ